MSGSEVSGIVAGIDVGGTFTDLMLFDAGAGTVRIAKTPTTPANQAFGVVAALEAAEVPLAGIDLIVHGTTTTTNAVLERRLARTGHDHHRGLSRRDRARPPHPAAGLRHDRPLHADHPARPPARGSRARWTPGGGC